MNEQNEHKQYTHTLVYKQARKQDWHTNIGDFSQAARRAFGIITGLQTAIAEHLRTGEGGDVTHAGDVSRNSTISIWIFFSVLDCWMI